MLRVPATLHQRLRREAAQRKVSLNRLCVSLLDAATSSPQTGGGRSELVDTAATLFGDDLVGIVLFGSVARGDEHDGSDVDVLFVLRATRAINRALYLIWDEAPGADRISPHFVHLPRAGAAPTSLWIEVAIDGIVLHDPGAVIARRLSALRRALAAGVVRSATAHGQRYWIHAKGETGA